MGRRPGRFAPRPGIRYPHLHQPPRLLPRLAEYRYPGRSSRSCSRPAPYGLGSRSLSRFRRIGGPSTDFEKTVAQQEHQAWASSVPNCRLIAKPKMSRQTGDSGGSEGYKRPSYEHVHSAHPAARRGRAREWPRLLKKLGQANAFSPQVFPAPRQADEVRLCWRGLEQ